MSENNKGITWHISNILKDTEGKRDAIKNGPHIGLPDIQLNRREASVGIGLGTLFTILATRINPLDIINQLRKGARDLVTPDTALAAADLQKDDEKLTINEEILGIGFTTGTQTNLRAEPATAVLENNQNRNIDVVAELPQNTQVVIKSSVPSIDVRNTHNWYEVEVVADDTENFTGYIQENILDTTLEENLSYNTEIYNIYKIILATGESVNARENDALFEGVDLFAGYLQDLNIEAYPATVFASSNFDQLIRILLGHYRRNNLYTPENIIRDTYGNVNAMAEAGKIVFFNLGRNGGTTTDNIRKIIIHELTHTLQELLLGKELFSLGGRTLPHLERAYGPTIMSEGFPEMIGYQLSREGWRDTFSAALSITAAPNELITPDDFLAHNSFGGFAYGAFFCYFLEDSHPGGIVEFYRNIGESFKENNRVVWREVFTEVFGITFDEASDQFMTWKSENAYSPPSEIPTNFTEETRFVSIKTLSLPFVFNLDNHIWQPADTTVFNTTYKVQTEYGPAFKGTCGSQQNALVFEYQVQVSSNSSEDVLVSVSDHQSINQEITVGQDTRPILPIINLEGTQVNALSNGTIFTVVEVFQRENGALLATIEINGEVQDGYVRVDDLDTAFVPQ